MPRGHRNLTTAVVVPWRPGDAHREAAWQSVRAHIEQTYEVVEGTCPPGPWIKALAVQDAVNQTDADVLIVHDADVLCHGLADALERIDDRPVVIPHGKVLRLSKRGTTEFLAGQRWPDIHEEHRGMPGGGIVILRREVWDEVPMDPRFVGWGREDASWAHALACMSGKVCRFSHPLYHLWHPPQPRQSRALGSPENEALGKAYETASRDRQAMTALLAEARDALRRYPWLSPPSMTSKTVSAVS